MSRLSSFFSAVREHKWFSLLLLLAIAAIGYALWPSQPPEVIIRRSLYSWAERFSKEDNTNAANTSEEASSSPGAMLEGFGHVNRLVRDAFSEDAQIIVGGAGRSRGREDITRWSFSLRDKADHVRLTLKDVQITVNPQTKKEATVILAGTITVDYRGRNESQSYQCDLDMVLSPGDKKWRIAKVTARPVSTHAGNAAPAADSDSSSPQ